MTTAPDRWDSAYTGDSPALWDIGRPQAAFVRLADDGLLTGRVLDVGCGTGEHALLAASSGADVAGTDVAGIDVSPTAISMARAKAAERGLTARFEVASVFEFDADGAFDTVIDSGLFHVFDDPDRVRYVARLASVLRPGGTVYLMCFSDRQPPDDRPRRVTQDELRAAFADGWTVVSIEATIFEINPGYDTPTAQAWLATIERG